MLQSCPSEDILPITEEVLLCNPDLITAWSKRRERIRSAALKENQNSKYTAVNDTQSSSYLKLLLQQEMLFNLRCLKINPKSYSAWFHRHYLMDLMGTDLHAPLEIATIRDELKLCSKLLEVDSRNFHCWNYRTFLVAKAGPALVEEEVEFCTKCIMLNFSNRSAWHHRQRLIPLTTSGKWSSSSGVKKELKFLRNVYFTEPCDQSCWPFLRWLLLEWSPAVLGEEESSSLIEEEIEHLNALLEIDPESILALMTLLRLRKYGGGDVSDVIALLKKIDPSKMGYWCSL